MSVHPDRVVLSCAGHGLAVDINPEAHACVALYTLQYCLGTDIPENDAAVFAGRGDKGCSVENTKASPNNKLFVNVTLVRLLDAARDVVPESDTVIETRCKGEAAVGRETDVGDGRVIFVNECTEALAR